LESFVLQLCSLEAEYVFFLYVVVCAVKPM
jgi:hypothetical protein